MDQGFMVRPDCEATSFKEMGEMSHGQVDCRKLSVERGVPRFSRTKFLAVETQRFNFVVLHLIEGDAHFLITCVCV